MPTSVLLTYSLAALDHSSDGGSRPSSHAVFISVLLFWSCLLQNCSIYAACKAQASVPSSRLALAVSCRFARVKKSSLVTGWGQVHEGLHDPIFSLLHATQQHTLSTWRSQVPIPVQMITKKFFTFISISSFYDVSSLTVKINILLCAGH